MLIKIKYFVCQICEVQMSKMGSTDVPLRKESYSSVKGLIESIENDRNSDAFREPVDWEGKQARC